MISSRNSPLVPPEEFSIFLQQEVLQRRYEGESRDLTGGKVGVIAEAFKMCHNLREVMTRLSSDKPPPDTTTQHVKVGIPAAAPPPRLQPKNPD